MESDVSESKSAGFIPDTGYPAISSDLGIGWRLASATFLRFHCGGNRMGLFYGIMLKNVKNKGLKMNLCRC